jgi:hypothetical protein
VSSVPRGEAGPRKLARRYSWMPTVIVFEPQWAECSCEFHPEGHRPMAYATW